MRGASAVRRQRSHRWRALAAALAGILVLAACGSDGPEATEGDGAPEPAQQSLVASVASFDLAAGDEGRFLVGLLTIDELFISHGEVDLAFSYLGREQAEGEPQRGPETTASFLPVDGKLSGEGPAAGPPSEGRGVYEAEVAFDRPGIWEVEVTAELVDGQTLSGTAAFDVLPEHRVPAEGDPAPRTENLTLSSRDAPEAAIDSRAETQGRVPDEVLHRTTIADAIGKKRPFVAVFSTPVYCQSRFCGPVTDVVEDLAGEYGNRAEFVHVEIWRDFEGQVINKAAADWLLRDEGLQEPWVFLVGPDGKVAARWDNVLSRADLQAELEKLPRG